MAGTYGLLWAQRVLQIWELDILGPMPMSPSGNRYILTTVDHVSRWAEVVPILGRTSEAIAREFVSNAVARFGVAETIITDQGPCFESTKFHDPLDNWGVRSVRTSPHHSQTNRMTERFNRNITKMARKMDYSKYCSATVQHRLN